MKLWFVVAFIGLSANAAFAEPPVRSAAVGVFVKGEEAQLVPAFTNAVYIYLRHYDPELVTQDAEYAKMRVDYDFDYDIELKITSNVYEVIVTLAQKTPDLGKARKQAAHLAAGVFKTMQRSMMQRDRAPSRS